MFVKQQKLSFGGKGTINSEKSIFFFVSKVFLFVCSEVAVVVVVGIDDNLLNDNLGVNHDEFEGVPAWGDVGEGGIEPTEVVEHLIATG